MGLDSVGDKFNARPLSASSLAETTAQHIMDAIVDAGMGEADAFPSQYQLSESFGVSRTVIREATQILVSKGILDVKHGKRITIRPPSHEQIAESVSLAFRRSSVSVFDVLELRKVMEVEVAALAADRADADDLARMEESIVQMEQHLLEEKGYVEADIAFHRAIFQAARQPAFDLVLRSLNDYLQDSRKLSFRGEETTRRALAAHQTIYKAISGRNAAAARAEMLLHLQHTEADLRETLKG